MQETDRLGLRNYELGDTDWDHSDLVAIVDELAIDRGPIADRPASGAYDDELYYAVDQNVLWGWDETASEWVIRGGKGSSSQPLDSLVTESTQTSRFDRGAPTGIVDPTDFVNTIAHLDEANSRIFNGNAQYYSDDYGENFTNVNDTTPSGARPVLSIPGYLYAVAENPLTLYRSPVDNPPTGYSWTQLLQGQSGSEAFIYGGRFYGNFERHPDTGTMMATEYGSPSNGPRIYRSTDGGSFSQVYEASNHDHAHCIAPDPFESGHWIVALGDSQTKRFLESTDDGETWTLTDKFQMYDGHQAVGIDYSEDHIYFAEDKATLRTGPWAHHRDSGENVRVCGVTPMKAYDQYFDTAIGYSVWHDRQTNVTYFDVRPDPSNYAEYYLTCYVRGLGDYPQILHKDTDPTRFFGVDDKFIYRSLRFEAVGNGGV